MQSVEWQFGVRKGSPRFDVISGFMQFGVEGIDKVSHNVLKNGIQILMARAALETAEFSLTHVSSSSSVFTTIT